MVEFLRYSYNATKIHLKCTFKLYQLSKERKQILCGFLCDILFVPVALRTGCRARCTFTLKPAKERRHNVAILCPSGCRHQIKRFKRVRATFATLMPL